MPKPPPKPVFDWMETRRSPGQAKTQANTEKARREAMYRAELEERAALLHRLGHDKAQVRARLGANHGWDFAPDKTPLAPNALDAIVDRIFGQTPPARPTPRKGGPK
jgi:hypothetical protein